jgi:hypothetical protein
MLTAIVSVETVLLVALVVLVAALLRGHAELLRRLGPEDRPRPEDGPRSLPERPAAVRRAITAPELAGTTPTGDAVKLALRGSPTLLAFLSSGCTSCAWFWETLGEQPLPAGLEAVIVTRGTDREQRSKLHSFAPVSVPVVMSSEAWEDYAVPGSPYFVLVQDGAVRGEGVATTWHALTSLLADAIREQREASGIDERLAAVGIGPDHPSLYPGGSD